ncbi:leucine-rich repeat-containing protein 43 [Spea bombifrons]|uniref:leucine-rich repeat-containing protein 43 n=1 Tax=Spea bombifrons TaxID=233779 RepID=UPI00234B95E9|nr:leucine-rich repeat-containing protein 43 [Spea bombifrons]
MAEISVSAALKQQFKSLCLKSFPCGTGSWNNSLLNYGKSVFLHSENDNPENENLDSLTDLLTCNGSPWGLEGCSPETQSLRQLAIKRPENITDQFIFSYFKSVRLVDKQVSEVDEHLLRFHNLEELVLSANKITTIQSSNLPRTLKVLELCSNQISSLKDLSRNPPATLQHLGLAYNRIKLSSENIYLTSDIWPSLVSLDLSFNDLTDIFDLVPKLSTLPKLRILVLQGNPLTFIPYYRGYAIDSLPAMCVLDDIPILPDERHQFRGLSRRKDDLGSSAQILVSIGKLQGIPNPLNASEQQTGGEFPLITYSYYLTYEFIEDQKRTEYTPAPETVSGQHQQTPTKNETEQPVALTSHFHTGCYKTPALPWLEVIECNYKNTHAVRDLLELKAFLLTGMKVSVTEEKTLSWPLDPERTQNGAVISKPEKKGDGKDKGRSSSKGSKYGLKNKKKKEHLEELRHDPPIVRTLGSVNTSLEGLVLGETLVISVCNFGIACTEIEKPLATCEKNIKKSKDQKLTGGRESVETHKASGSSSGKRKQAPETKPPEDQLSPEPVPITAEIQVQLIRWNSPSEPQKK